MAVITIARQFGAGGRTLGNRLAKALNYRFLDDVVIQELARRINVTHEAVQDIENIAGGFFSKIVSSMLSRSYMERMTGEDFGYIDEVIYLKTLKEVMVDLAAKDNIILLGRGGQYILENHPNAFHVLLVADKQYRVEFMQKAYNLNSAKAESAVREGEKRRGQLYSLFKRSDYNDPLHYHMVFNTRRVTLDQTEQQIVSMVRQASVVGQLDVPPVLLTENQWAAGPVTKN
jgi:cytidylate kinase